MTTHVVKVGSAEVIELLDLSLVLDHAMLFPGRDHGTSKRSWPTGSSIPSPIRPRAATKPMPQPTSSAPGGGRCWWTQGWALGLPNG